MNRLLSFPDALAFTDFPPGQRVFKFSEIEQLKHVEQSVSAARLRLQKSEHEFEKNLAKKSKQAFDQGYQTGLNQAVAELTDLLANCHLLQPQIVKLVMNAIKKVLDELPQEELVANLALTAVRQLTTEFSRLIIRVHPDVEHCVKQRLEKRLPCSILKQGIQVKSNIDFSKTDCQIESSLGVINANLNAQLDAIEKAFVQSKWTEPDSNRVLD